MAKAKARPRTKQAALTRRVTTTIRVRASTKALIEQMVEAEGSTYDEVIARMARRERQRTIGAQLAHRELTMRDAAVVRAGADTVARASR